MTNESPWRWPIRWARDESFWKEVAQSTVSGVVLIFLTWAAAVSLGYLQKPEFVHGLNNVLLLVAIVGIVLALPLQAAHALRLRRDGDEQWKIWAYSVAIDLLAVPVLVIFLVQTWEYTA